MGTRLGDIETQGYATLAPPAGGPSLIHVHPSPEELGRVYEPTLGIVSAGAAFAEALSSLPPLGPGPRGARMRAAHNAYLGTLGGRELPGAVDLAGVLAVLYARVPENTILASGAGNFSVWAHRFWAFRRAGTQLAPASGAMGYGLPAAIAAKLLDPERVVVCIAGDGDFMMSLPELATAVQHKAGVLVLVVDNGMYGTIRMHQERHYPTRVNGTDLRNPDFVALAHSFGCHAERIDRTEEAGAAIDRALSSGRVAVLHLPVDPEAITPRATLTEIRAASFN